MIRGFVRGKTIELDAETGLPDGQEVSVSVCPVGCEEQSQATGDGLKRAFGGWADESAELDKFLDWNRQQRKVIRSEPRK